MSGRPRGADRRHHAIPIAVRSGANRFGRTYTAASQPHGWPSTMTTSTGQWSVATASRIRILCSALAHRRFWPCCKKSSKAHRQYQSHDHAENRIGSATSREKAALRLSATHGRPVDVVIVEGEPLLGQPTAHVSPDLNAARHLLK